MKSPILLFLMFFFLSCKQTYYVTPSGKKINEKKEKRIINRAVNKAYKKLSKEEKESLKNVKLEVIYDTILN